ncbi:MAG: hypothetical protein K9J75_05825 [Cyanobium usitatum Tobar12.5m-G36]|nr:hypothetical protein [Cyanobium usitatum Tobar12.5m-G36]
MTTNSPYTIKLPAKTETSECYWYTKGVRGDCPNPAQLLNSYEGQVVIEAQTWEALFYSPSVAECNDPIKNPDCKLEARLSSASLEKLSLDNIPFRKHLESLGINFYSKTSETEIAGKDLARPNEDISRQGNNNSISGSQGSRDQGFFDPLFQHGPVLLGSFVVIIVACFAIKKAISMAKSPSQKSSRKAIIQEQPLASPSVRSFPSGQVLNSVVSAEISRQLFPFQEEIKNLKSQVKILETDLIGLSQELHASVAKPRGLFPEPMPQQVSLNTGGLTQSVESIQPIPPFMPAPLSVDLIKKAVASGDYTLISNHPHLFLSETLDSQKGLEEVKCFSIDGDQSQASSKSQSEFIAINCSDDTYLIPNIIPNAADPARTLKRHADKNNIYRNGHGGNFLNLDQLAVVQKNGDRFDLKKPGQIV